MDNDYTNTNTESSMQNDASTMDKTRSFRESSPDEVRERVKEAVQKGVAAVAGALKGFSEEAKKHNLAESTKEAIHKAGETTRQVAGTTAKEFQRTKEHLKSEVKGFRSGANTAPPVGESSTLGSTGTLGGSSSLGSSTSLSGTSGMGGSQLGTGSSSNVRGTSTRDSSLQGGAKSTTPKVPDLRNVELGKTDEDLEK